MPENELQQLQDAVARNTAAVLSLPSAGMLRHQKARFLAYVDDSFWIECAAEDRALIDQLIASQTPAAVSFKTSQIKSVFTAPILERMDDYRINADTTVCAVRVKAPQAIKQMQRRLNYRVAVPKDSEILLDVWRIAPRIPLRDRPSATQRVQAEIIDLSTGGVGVTFIGVDGEPPRVCEEDRLRIHITCADTELLIEGAMRKPLPGNDKSRVRTGIAFKALQHDLEGRQNLAKLTKIVGELQRHEARRARLGVA
jgi:c-di-GMP-binding flagellar brake protein YcgR